MTAMRAMTMRRIVMLGAVTVVALLLAPPVFRSHRAMVGAVESSGVQRDEAEKSGCCSWHGGVCGCSGGRQVCCDGTLSPTCTC